MDRTHLAVDSMSALAVLTASRGSESTVSDSRFRWSRIADGSSNATSAAALSEGALRPAPGSVTAYDHFPTSNPACVRVVIHLVLDWLQVVVGRLRCPVGPSQERVQADLHCVSYKKELRGLHHPRATSRTHGDAHSLGSVAGRAITTGADVSGDAGRMIPSGTDGKESTSGVQP